MAVFTVLFLNLGCLLLAIDDPDDLLFAFPHSQRLLLSPGETPSAVQRRLYGQLYKAEEILYLPSVKQTRFDDTLFQGKRFKSIHLQWISPDAVFPYSKALKNMPLESVDLSFTRPGKVKLSDLREFLKPSLKKLRLFNVILDDPSLLHGLDLETLELNAVTLDDEIINVIAGMKHLKRLELRLFETLEPANLLPQPRQDIPFEMLKNLSLTALTLSATDASARYFIQSQKQLRILMLTNIREPEPIIPVLAGREFEYLMISSPYSGWEKKEDQKQKILKLLKQYKVSAKLLFINGARINEEADIK